MIRKKEGFTLVELLVVIAIIIILAAILFPVFARAREKAQQSRCVNNLKQMGTAISMYEDDYDAPMPWAVRGWMAGYLWKDLMDPYLKQLKGVAGSVEREGELYRCPSAPVEEAVDQVRAGRNYGYNPYLQATTGMNAVKFPGSTLRITECDGKDPDGDPKLPMMGGSAIMPLPSGAGAEGAGFYRYAPGWHNGFNDCLWFDGHVSSIPRQRVMLTDRNPGDMNVWGRLAPKPGYTPEG